MTLKNRMDGLGLNGGWFLIAFLDSLRRAGMRGDASNEVIEMNLACI